MSKQNIVGFYDVGDENDFLSNWYPFPLSGAASGSGTSAADEILKQKHLWDSGILTEEELEDRKEQG